MNTYYVEVRVHVQGADDLDRHTDDVMDALLDEPNIIDPDLGVDLETARLDVCMSVDAADQGAALQTALAALRSAVHGLGVMTPGWEANLPHALTTVRPAGLDDELADVG